MSPVPSQGPLGVDNSSNVRALPSTWGPLSRVATGPPGMWPATLLCGRPPVTVFPAAQAPGSLEPGLGLWGLLAPWGGGFWYAEEQGSEDPRGTPGWTV